MMTSLRRALCPFLLLGPLYVATPRLEAAPTPSNAVLVLEKEQNTLVIVDPVTLTIVARVPVGHDPHEVAVSADGRIAYISNYNGGNTIARVDLVAQKGADADRPGGVHVAAWAGARGGEAVLYGGGSKGGGAVRPVDGEDRLGHRDGAGSDAYGDCDEGFEDGDDVEREFGDDQLYRAGARRGGRGARRTGLLQWRGWAGFRVARRRVRRGGSVRRIGR